MTTWDRGLVKVVNEASAAVSDPSRWDAMLRALSERFDATSGAIFTRPTAPASSPTLSATLNLPIDGMKSYLEQWVQHDPWLASACRSPMVSGNCYIGRALCEWADLDRSMFYNEFSKFQGVRGLLSLLVDDGRQPCFAPFTFLSLYRAPGSRNSAPTIGGRCGRSMRLFRWRCVRIAHWVPIAIANWLPQLRWTPWANRF